MTTRNSTMFALGLAAALTVGGSMTVEAQRTPTRARPAQSIPVRKDTPVATKPDTVTITRVDTVIVRRSDTVTTTVLRVDTVTRQVMPPMARQPGMYFGLGGGVAIPMNNFRNVVKDGPMITGQVGYFPPEGMLGLRADLSYAKLGHRETDCKGCKDPNWFTGGVDLIARFPLDRYSKVNPTIYALGGVGFSTLSESQRYYNTDNRVVNPNGTSFKWEVGPGIAMKVGGFNMFAEGKYISIRNFAFANNTLASTPNAAHTSTNTHLFPVTIGVQFF